MKAVKALALLMFIAGTMLAQDRPNRTAAIRLAGPGGWHRHFVPAWNKVDVRVQEGAPIQQVQFHFYDPLPDARSNARLEVIQGRGYVHVIDQPRLDNQYTLAISIEDRQPGSSFYSLALYWDASTRRFEFALVAPQGRPNLERPRG